MENRRPNPVDERLNEVMAEGIRVYTYQGKFNETFQYFKRQFGKDFYFGNVTKPIIGRFSDGSAEIVSAEETFRTWEIADEYGSYAIKQGFVKKDEPLKMEAHAIYEPNIDITHFFVLPARSYLDKKPEEKKELQ